MINKEDIKKICESTLEIQKCIDDDVYLCEVLNSVDKNFLREYYKSDRVGPVVNLRKQICREVLLDDITVDKLSEIISKHKSDNKSAFKSWSTNFSILHTIIIDKYKNIDKIVSNIVADFSNIIENSDHIIWDFKGGRNQGQNNYCFAFYNKTQKNQSSSLQLFVDFNNGRVKYGIYKHSTKEYPFGELYCEFDEFEKVYSYVEDNKDIIINDISESNVISVEHTFISASINVLKFFENKPMSAKEIWDHIEKNGIYKTSGKTPAASLNTIMSGSSINSNNSNKSKKMIFECVGDKPIKYRLINYTPKRIRESLIDDGFITKEMLIEILSKNNINIEI